MHPKLHDEYTHHPWLKGYKYYRDGWTHFSSWRLWFTCKASASVHAPSAEILFRLRLQNVRKQKMRDGSTNPFTSCKRCTQSSLIPRQLFVIYSSIYWATFTSISKGLGMTLKSQSIPLKNVVCMIVYYYNHTPDHLKLIIFFSLWDSFFTTVVIQNFKKFSVANFNCSSLRPSNKTKHHCTALGSNMTPVMLD